MWQAKDLRVQFLEVWQGKDLERNEAGQTGVEVFRMRRAGPKSSRHKLY